MSLTGAEPSAIFHSVHDAAVREVNALEQLIVSSEDDADEKLWEQARQVVSLLEAGMTQRALARQWINARTGGPYSHRHVGYTAQAFGKFTSQVPRPRFRDVYNAAANATTARVSVDTRENEWYTPPEYIEAAKAVMHGIDVDPASCERANRIVGASTYYTAEDDGLTKEWPGRVFLNPPYSQPLISEFCAKLIEQHSAGITTEAIVLVNNATDTAWFQTLLGSASAVCFPNRRISFMRAEGDSGSPRRGQAVVFLGSDTDSFASRFVEFGAVLRPEYRCQPTSQGEDAA